MRQDSTASSSSSLDCAEKAGVVAHERLSGIQECTYKRKGDRERATVGMRIHARTTVRIWRHADYDHKAQDPKMRRQTYESAHVAWVTASTASCEQPAFCSDIAKS